MIAAPDDACLEECCGHGPKPLIECGKGTAQVRRRYVNVLVATMLIFGLCITSAAGQSAHSATSLSFAGFERRTVNLKPGMTREEVEKLLGKPRRTSLRAASYRGSEDRLEWTYPWPNRADPERTFQVVFSSTLPGQWLVSTWQWSGY